MPIETDPDTVQRLVGLGDEVETPEGKGVVVDIVLNAADYPDGTELEPPAIGVELDSGETIYTCLCELELDSEEATELLHSEFDRLWPAKEGPEDAEMLIPEEPEEAVHNANYRRAQQINWSTGQAPPNYEDLALVAEALLASLPPQLKQNLDAWYEGSEGESYEIPADARDSFDLQAKLPGGKSWRVILDLYYFDGELITHDFEVCTAIGSESWQCEVGEGSVTPSKLGRRLAELILKKLGKTHSDKGEILDYMYDLLESNAQDFFAGDPLKWEVAETLAKLTQEEFGPTNISINTLKLWAADVVEEFLQD